jgi:hypothetical protein
LIVLATRVPLEFERVRFRVITAPRPAEGQSLSVSLPDPGSLAGSPAAVVVRLRGGTASTRIALGLDGTAIADIVLPPNREIRVDASTVPPPGAGHHLLVSGDRAGWQLTYLEIANVHGFSRGLFDFNVVPRDRKVRHAPWWLVVAALVGLLALRPRPDWPLAPARRRVHRIGIGLVLLLFVAIVIADRFTPFKILLGIQTFLLCVAVLYAERTAQVCRAVWRFGVPTGGKALAVYHWIRQTGETVVDARPWITPAIAGVAAVSVCTMALALGSHYAGGADSYGYVAQAELWARGQLYVDQPIVSELPPDVGEEALTPLGFAAQTHSGIPGRLVPTYSPGLPIAMGAFRRMLGQNAVFLVVPLLAGATIWLTFVLGRCLDSDATGLVAALWLTFSPAFVNSALNPLSDVPVTAWWLAALVSAVRPTLGSAAIAGVAVSAAVLTRPNLAPLTAVIALPFAIGWLRQPRATPRVVQLGVFLITAAAGPAIVAALFNYWYGSPFTSGYGSTGGLFSWSYIAPNLARYPRWFVDTQTLLILAGLATPVLLRGRTGAPGWLRPSSAAWLLLAFSALVWGAYLAYYYFDAWWYLRFLLPSYPALIVLASAALVFVLRRTAAPGLLGATVIVLIAAHGLHFCWQQSVFNIAAGEARYQRVGEFAGRSLSERSLLLSMQHSGSLRYYSRLTTLRYDLIPDDRLDAIVAHFAARGRLVYIVVDEWEKEPFRQRFAPRNALGALEWTPMAVSSGGMPVSIYDPRDRRAARPVATQIIP